MARDGKLVVEDVACRFGDTLALSGVSLEAATGEFVSIVGPSGCGKSTLFNVVSGLLPPTAGRVLIDGLEVTGRTGNVGYMFQKDLLVPWRTVVGNIVLGAALTRRVTERDLAEARELGARYGLGGFLDHYPHALSGGMRQRVALMRTLAMHEDVLLLDEPFGALDSQTRLEMQRWLLEVWGELERTVLFVTHDVDEAVFLADRVTVMTPRPGRIASQIPVDIERPRDLSTLTDPGFMAIKRRVLALLYGEAG
ncbi:MAG TPA: ABC transporter ATP-binding protein [Actinomycetota bacterium]|nr:ABC transporter ATP-binding protein [Actinomycetota bacterium]